MDCPDRLLGFRDITQSNWKNDITRKSAVDRGPLSTPTKGVGYAGIKTDDYQKKATGKKVIYDFMHVHANHFALLSMSRAIIIL